MMESINISQSVSFVGSIPPPFDIKKAVENAFRIGGIIYIGTSLFDSVYEYLQMNVDKPYSLDIDNPYQPIGAMKIIVTDLIPENEYKVMSPREFEKQYGKNIQ